jgi:aspartate aminotransferase
MNERSAELARQGREVFRLGFGQSPFPVPGMVVEALRAHAHEKDYLPVRGLPALRAAVAEHLASHHRLRRPPDLIQIGPGTKELIFLTQLVLDAEVVLPSPSWVSYAPQAALLGRPVAWLPTTQAERWTLDPERLDAYCRAAPARPRILVLNSPNNPNGATIPGSVLAALAEVCRRHRLLVVSDEIYGLTDHAGGHRSIAEFYEEGTAITTGLSKWCGAGGWRLGVLSVPPALAWLADAVAVAAGETFTSVSAPIQHAAVVAFRGGPELEAYLDGCRRILGPLGRWCAAALAEVGYGVDPPDGGFYLFPDATPLRSSLEARGIGTGAALCERLLADTGVALLPGAAFGRPEDELTFRLSYVDFDGGEALRAIGGPGVEVDSPFLERYCPRVVGGVRRMAAWVTQPAAGIAG